MTSLNLTTLKLYENFNRYVLKVKKYCFFRRRDQSSKKTQNAEVYSRLRRGGKSLILKLNKQIFARFK